MRIPNDRPWLEMDPDKSSWDQAWELKALLATRQGEVYVSFLRVKEINWHWAKVVVECLKDLSLDDWERIRFAYLPGGFLKWVMGKKGRIEHSSLQFERMKALSEQVHTARSVRWSDQE